MTRLVTALLLLTVCARAETDLPSASDAVFVLSVGYPHAPRKESLRYPAWDAARFVEAVAGVYDPDGTHQARYALLADFRSTADRDLFAHHAVRPPTRASLVRAVEDLNRRMDAVRTTGARPVLLFFYAGHGEVGSGNMGRVYLRPGGRDAAPGVGEALTANGLRQLVLERARADRVHVMVDACNAYFLLKSRGRVSSSRRSRRQGRLGRRFAARLPHVGVVLSTSGVANVYESRTLQGGLFSHVLRSAIAGAGDLDADGSVSYAEMTAFFDEAFRGVVNRDRFSPDVFVQPPRDDAAWDAPWDTAAMLALPAAPALGVRLEAGAWRHLFVTDGRGLRLAEIHHDGATPLRLWLPSAVVRGSTDPLVVHAVDGEGSARPIGTLPSGSGWQTPGDGAEAGLNARGITEDVVRQMFGEPAGRSRLSALAGAEARARRDAVLAERARDHYFGLRTTVGATGRIGGEVEGLGVAPTVGLEVRGERRRLVYGVGGHVGLPRPMASPRGDGGTVDTYTLGLDGLLGWAWPLGPVQLDPRALMGAAFRIQDGDRVAYGIRGAFGLDAVYYLPTNTDWALTVQTRVGPEYLLNVRDRDGRTAADLGWVWTVSVGADLELPR